MAAITFTPCLGQSSDHQMKIAVNPVDSQHYVWIPPGTYQMGCSFDDRACKEMEPFSNENPRHSVTISKGFWMGQTEVTVGAYRKYAEATGNKSLMELVLAAPEMYRDNGFPQSDDHPVAFVTWEDNRNDTHPVGKKAPNDFGLYDLLGNVSEYCNDWYGEKYYEVSVEADPEGPSNGEFRVIRGGEYRSRPLAVRVSWRSYMLLNHRFKSIGFRCVLDSISK